MNKQEQYTMHIYDAVIDLFREDDITEESAKLDLNKVDGTQFFIAFVKAGNLLLNLLTGEDKSHLEFTYFANHLIVQDIIENNKKEESAND